MMRFRYVYSVCVYIMQCIFFSICFLRFSLVSFKLQMTKHRILAGPRSNFINSSEINSGDLICAGLTEQVNVYLCCSQF